MNILTHRRPGKLKLTNDVRINGRLMKKDISGVSGFVQQEELFIGSLTIREHLKFHVISSCIMTFSMDEFIDRRVMFRRCFDLVKNLPKMNESIVLMRFSSL
jgi:ABC-type multidrug transport system ATPase subunit